MTTKTSTMWICDGCNAATNALPSWIHGVERCTYESNVGLISTGPDRNFDYCRGCWNVMKDALHGRHGQCGLTAKEKDNG